MAIYNEILAPRYARLLQKLFAIKGAVPTRQLAGEVTPVFRLFGGTEVRYLEDWRKFGSSQAVGAVAAQNSTIRLVNPLGSNTIAILEGMTIFESLADPTGALIDFSAVGNQPNLTTVNSPALFDGRFNPPGTGNNGAQLVTSGGNNIGAATFITCYRVALLANTMSNELINFEEQEIPILPGGSLQVRSGVLNVALSCNFRWRERNLEESERTAIG